MIGRRRFLLLAGGAGAAGFLAWKLGGPAPAVTKSARALGTTVSITAAGAHAGGAVDAAFAELDAVEEVMSLYRPHSGLCRLNREGVLERPHPWLVEVLEHAQAMARATDGAFDVTVQPLWRLYAKGRTPSDAEVAAAKALVDWRRLDVSRDRVRLAPGMEVTLNGIAQGFAADRALAALRSRGVTEALVDTGELGGIGRPWTVGVQHPREPEAYVDLARLDGRCMATSGDYATSFSPDRADNHIFDPRTGRSPLHFSSVTVVAPTGMAADALSTAIFVLGRERGLELARASGAEALFVLRNGRTMATRGFPRA